jgi:hypothetical protein
MTIHADFFKIVKEGCGHAFSDAAPTAPDVVFIDGQVKLMKADAVTSWDLFFSIQFYKTIERAFGLGASTVVLGFDDYEHVPTSKAMTQAKRAKQRVDYEFAHTSALPSRPPDDWGSAMANRTFKVKVVSRVLDVTRAWFEHKLKTDAKFANWTLVLDHRGVPDVVHAPDACRGCSVRRYVDERDWSAGADCVGRGECDIKAYSWLPLASCLCIMSVDGDYLPLSLLQCAAGERDVLLYRMVTQLSSCGKRKCAEPAAKSAGRKYEFVRIAPVREWVCSVFPSRAVNPVQQFCAMVALCGCDFARNLPRLGPRSLWKMRQRLQNADLSNPTQALCAVSLAYHDMFVSRNTVPARATNSIAWFSQATETLAMQVYEDLLQRVAHDLRVSERIRAQMWTAATTRAHARNASWTMRYWSMLECAPDPLSADYGYQRDSKGRTGFAA